VSRADRVRSPHTRGAAAILFAAMLAGLPVASTEPQPSVRSPSIAITNVSIVDVPTGALRPRVTVIVRDGRIVSIESTNARAPSDARIVDGSGRFLIAGLWDMHVHLSEATEASLPLLIANGVTGVRDMGSDLDEIKRWRGAIEAGRLVGPRIVAAGPKLDGEGTPATSSRIVRTPEEARKAVDDLAAAGADFIKVHAGLDRPRFRAIAAQSRARGLRFSGHLPDDVTPADAARMGIQSIEHFSGFPGPCSEELKRLLEPSQRKSAPMKCAPDSELDATFAVLRNAGTWVTPTLVSYRGRRWAPLYTTRLHRTRLHYRVPAPAGLHNCEFTWRMGAPRRRYGSNDASGVV